MNVTARAGDGRGGRRVMSQVGFLEAVSVVSVQTDRAHYQFDDTEELRQPKQIVLVGYGLNADYKRLASSLAEDRLLRNSSSPLHSGVAVYPDDSRLLMSGDLSSDTTSRAKTSVVVQAMTGRQGPAPHFVVTRKGGLIIGPSIDATTTVIPALSQSAIFVMVESALVMLRSDHESRRYDRLMEAPMPLIQASTLATLINKLLVAVGSTVSRSVITTVSADASGIVYRRADTLPSVPEALFRSPPTLPDTTLRLDYATSTPEPFLRYVDAQGSYDLATQVWEPPNAPPTPTGRVEALTAIAQTDTAGAESVYMGAYATLAAEERALDMARTVRSQIFVQRHRTSVQNSEEAGAQAARVAEAGSGSLLPTEVPANVGPHSYDFTTGLWGDNKAV